MIKHYKNKQLTTQFTGIGLTKQLIDFMLTFHIDEWYNFCHNNSNQNQIDFNDTLMSNWF